MFDSEDKQALFSLLNGYRATALIYTAVKLGIPDRLAAGACGSAALAEACGAHEPSLRRIMKGLTLLGVCIEMPDAEYALGALGEHLTSDSTTRLRDWAILCGAEYMRAWSELPYSVRFGSPGFDEAFGMSASEHREQDPLVGPAFNRWIAMTTTGVAGAIIRAGDFSRFQKLEVLGAGNAALLAAILADNAGAEGILLAQLSAKAAALDAFEEIGVSDRAKFVVVDSDRKISGEGDLLLVKDLISGMDDDKGGEFLLSCRAAMSDHAVLMLIERVLPERIEDDPFSIMLDLHMMAITGGRERTEEEFRVLLHDAGFPEPRVTPTGSGFYLIETEKEQG